MHAATSIIASAPRLAEDVTAFVPVVPSRHAREKRFWRPISPKLSGRHFFGVTMFAPSRFPSASDICELHRTWRSLSTKVACPKVRNLPKMLTFQT